MKQRSTQIFIAAILILMAAAARIVNFELHLYNFAPVAALGLFSGAVVKDKRYAFLFVLLAELLGDTYISLFTTWQGFYGIDQFFVYGAMMLVTLLGTQMKQVKALNVLGYSVASSVLFFIISNFGVWVSIEMGKDLFGYGTGLHGMAATYIAAIPFFKYTLVGDLAGSIVLFGGYQLLQHAMVGKMQKAKA